MIPSDILNKESVSELEIHSATHNVSQLEPEEFSSDGSKVANVEQNVK